MEQLAKLVMIQAIKDYIAGDDNEKKDIIEDLNGNWMNKLTDGKSVKLAEILQSADLTKIAQLLAQYEAEVI